MNDLLRVCFHFQFLYITQKVVDSCLPGFFILYEYSDSFKNMLAILISLNISGFQKEVDIVKRFYFSCKCTC